MNRTDRRSALLDLLEHRIAVLDGAMGTAIQALNLSAKDFGGEALDGCNENLVLTRPDVIEQIHSSYLKVGVDIVETDTFGGTPLVLEEYNLGNKTVEINRRAGEIARKAADHYWTASHPRFVAGSMGPTTKAISVTGGVTFEELMEHYYLQAKGLHEGEVDYFLLETAQDTRNVKAGILGFERLFREGYERIPVAVSGTIEASGTMLGGQTIDAFWGSLAHLDLLYIGLNCATGPEFMTDHLRTLSRIAPTRVACVPNAGLPDENGHYLESPEMISRAMRRFVEEGWVNLIGGCCGTVPAHIERLVEMAKNSTPRRPSTRRFTFVSGIDFLEFEDDRRPVLVGERTNVIGSRKFKDLVVNNDFEMAAEVGRSQIRGGAQVVDICLANPDRNEMDDMRHFLERAIKMIRVPFMIDSTDEKVIEEALPYSQGKAIINSINLEDGEERFEKVIPLAQRYGAALVVGLIDEKGMGVSKERKLEIAKRSFKLLTEKYNVPAEDIIWDPLVFPCGTGDAQYIGSAVETMEGLFEIKKEFPETKTILGISNVSFGLPTTGREVLNSVFLYHCTLAGLDMAIVNTELLQRYPSIPDEERKLAENLLWNRDNDPVAAFAAYFRGKKKVKKDLSTLPLHDRLANYILEGSKEGLVEDLKKALQTQRPLDIINGPLMKGMDEVGRLFNKNELIVAEVLQSAEAMKASVSFLEPFMEKTETMQRGKVILATVKGDVHDIGKNLVEIILSNNGFKVINLGIKVPPEQLLSAAEEHRPDMIGLSGLLVKSAQQMVITAQDLSKGGCSLPILVGGAALTKNFTEKKIATAYSGVVAYAKDAMEGLDLAKKIVDPEQMKELKEKQRALSQIVGEPSENGKGTAAHSARSNVSRVSPPTPADLKRHVLLHTPLDEIWAYINPRMLFGRHLGLSNSSIENNDPKMIELSRVVNEVKAICKKEKLLAPKAIYQFFPVQGNGESIHFYNSDRTKKIATLPFPRQPVVPHLCLSDFVSPDDPKENLSAFVITSGHGVREKAEQWKQEGEYLKSHILSALALESAEGYAEWLHTKIRGIWGILDDPKLTMMEKFQARYQGKRYSFGYPACPDLDGQKILFELLKPLEIGVELTEGMMMDPEASVSAIVFHHPEARYFGV